VYSILSVLAPSCHFGKTSDSDRKGPGIKCPSDPGFSITIM